MFNGQLFDQIDGVAMGSSLGPSLAKIFIRHLEKRYLANCPSELKPVLYRRYGYDTYCLFRDRDHVIMFVEYINCQHPKIDLTSESESENSLPLPRCPRYHS